MPDIAQALATATVDFVAGDEPYNVESGREDQNICLRGCTFGRDDRVREDLRNPVGDQVDVRADQRAEPAIVQKHSLAKRWVMRNDLLQQISTVAEFLLDVLGEVVAVSSVGAVDRRVAACPIGVALKGAVQLVVEDPFKPEAIPRVIQGYFTKQQPHGFGHLLLELLKGLNPLW